MALIDLNLPGPVSDPARLPKTFRDVEGRKPVPRGALARLSILHDEAQTILRLSQFLAGAPKLCLALMLAAVLSLIWVAASVSLQARFVWAVMVLIGILGMTRNAIQAMARSPQQVPLQKSVWELRMLLLYTGTAWGTGAYLLMPNLPTAALVFAVTPSLAAALVLKDEIGAAAFAGPVSLATVSAAMLGAFDLWVAGAVLVAGGIIASLTLLRRAVPRQRDMAPAWAPQWRS